MCLPFVLVEGLIEGQNPVFRGPICYQGLPARISGLLHDTSLVHFIQDQPQPDVEEEAKTHYQFSSHLEP